METKNIDKNINYIIENIITKKRYNQVTKRFEITEEDYLNLNLSTNQKRLLREICQNLGIFLEYTDPTQIELPSYEDEALFKEYNQIKRKIDESDKLSKTEFKKLEQMRIEIRNKIVEANMILIETIIERRTEWLGEISIKDDIYQIGYEILIRYIDENYLVPGELKNSISKRLMPYIDRQLFIHYGIIKSTERSLKISKKKLEMVKQIITPIISIEEEIKKINEQQNDELSPSYEETSPLYNDTFENTLIETIDKKHIIAKIISTLPKQEQEILNLYFGFQTGKNHSIIEIAKIYNVSKARIFAIINKSLKSISNSIRIIYLSELYEVSPTYQFDESVHKKLEIFLIIAIEEELLNEIIKNLNKQEQEMLFLYQENPEYTKLEISKIMNISSYATTKIQDKIFTTIRKIISEYLQTKYNKEISYEEYLKYLMELYINKNNDYTRTKRKD